MVNECALTLGSLQIAGDVPGGPFTFSTLADDLTWGSPQPVEVAVKTLLQNSSALVTERYDNREVNVRVQIDAQDGQALAQAEAALFAELGKRNTLVWTPPDGYAPPTVFRVVTSSMEHAFDDLGDLYNRRVYGIRLVCEAFARSVDEVVTVGEVQQTSGGVPVTPIDTLVDDCSATTNWAAIGSGTSLASSGGALSNTPAYTQPTLRRTATIDMSATPFLVVDAKTSTRPSSFGVRFNGSGTLTLPTASGASPTAGYTRYWFKTALTSVTQVGVAATFPTTGRLYVTEVRKTNQPPTQGTLRQKLMTVEVPGSAPSDGTIEVVHPTSNLGRVAVYTWPNEGGQGFSPALRPYRVSGSLANTDNTTASGAYEDIFAASTVYQIPAAMVTAGTYEVYTLQRLRTTSGTATVSATFKTKDAGGNQLDGQIDLSITANFPTAASWTWLCLGRAYLPNVRVTDSTTNVVEVTINRTTAPIDLDEVYLFNKDTGALTTLYMPNNRHLWIYPATLDWPMPSVMIGNADDGSDAVSAGSSVNAWGVHQTTPPSINAFTLTRTAEDAQTTARAVPAHHTHATL